MAILVLAVVAGLLAAAAFPPVDVAVLGVVGLTGVLMLLASGDGPGGAVRVLLGFSVAYFGVLFVWSLRFGVAPYVALVVSQALFVVPVGLVAAAARRCGPGAWVVAVTAAWTLAEALRARVPLGGFEWGQLGVMGHGLPVRGAAAVVGTLGLGALLVALAATVAVAVLRRAGWGRSLAAVGVLVVGLAALGQLPWTRSTGGLDVAVVQTAPVCPGVYAVDCPDEPRRLRERFAAAAADLPAGLDLVLWGEGALGGPSADAAGAQLVDEMGPLPAPLLVGVSTPGPDDTFRNRNVLFDVDGTVAGSYDKRHPVPFGEYVPGREWFGGVGDVGRLVPRDMAPGVSPGRLALDGHELGTVSSWEVTFSRLVRETARLGQLTVTLTTQETYEQAAVSDQLLRAAQLRAVETGRPMLVAATTGRSAAIAAGGDRRETTRLYDADVLLHRVTPRDGMTPYLRTGDLPVLLVALVALAGVAGRSWWARTPR